MSARADVLRLETELSVVKADKERMQGEIERMRGELSHFGSDFFDEIEDLKYNYSEAIKRNVLYEEKLRHLSQQFGVHVDLPSPDSP